MINEKFCHLKDLSLGLLLLALACASLGEEENYSPALRDTDPQPGGFDESTLIERTERFAAKLGIVPTDELLIERWRGSLRVSGPLRVAPSRTWVSAEGLQFTCVDVDGYVHARFAKEDGRLIQFTNNIPSLRFLYGIPSEEAQEGQTPPMFREEALKRAQELLEIIYDGKPPSDLISHIQFHKAVGREDRKRWLFVWNGETAGYKDYSRGCMLEFSAHTGEFIYWSQNVMSYPPKSFDVRLSEEEARVRIVEAAKEFMARDPSWFGVYTIGGIESIELCIHEANWPMRWTSVHDCLDYWDRQTYLGWYAKLRLKGEYLGDGAWIPDSFLELMIDAATGELIRATPYL